MDLSAAVRAGYGGSGNPTPYVYFRLRGNGTNVPTTPTNLRPTSMGYNGIAQWGYDAGGGMSGIQQNCTVTCFDGTQQGVGPVYHWVMTQTQAPPAKRHGLQFGTSPTPSRFCRRAWTVTTD